MDPKGSGLVGVRAGRDPGHWLQFVCGLIQLIVEKLTHEPLITILFGVMFCPEDKCNEVVVVYKVFYNQQKHFVLFFPSPFSYMLVRPMVLILDGNSEKGAHVFPKRSFSCARTLL